jgi:hypothetical protein
MELSGIQIAGIVLVVLMLITIVSYSACKQYFTGSYKYKLPTLGQYNNLQKMTVPSVFKKFLEPSSEEPSSEEPSSEEPSSEEPSSEEPSSEEPSSEEPSSEEPGYSNPNNLLNRLYNDKKKNLNQFPKLSLIGDFKSEKKKPRNPKLKEILNDLSNSAFIGH